MFYWGKDTHRKQCRHCGKCLVEDDGFGRACSMCWDKICREKIKEKTRRKEEKCAALKEQERLRQMGIDQKRQQGELERQRVREIEMVQYHQLRKDIEAMPQYRIWREEILNKFGRKCSICGSTENIEVDHRYESFYSIIKKHAITNTVQAYECATLWDVNNGAPLCKMHHDQTKSSTYRQQKT